VRRLVRRLGAAVVPILLAGTVVLLAAHPAYAAEEGGESSPLMVVFKWINFAVVAGAFGWLLAKKAPGFFAARANRIASAIEQAAQAKGRADAQRRQAEERLANLGREIEELRARAARDAASEAQRIEAATQEEVAKIERSGHMEVEAAARGARLELRALASRLSIERAEAVLRAEITPATEEGMFAAFLGELVGPAGGRAQPGGQARPGGQTGRPN